MTFCTTEALGSPWYRVAVCALGIMMGCHEGLNPEAFESRVRESGGGARFVFTRAEAFSSCHASTLVQLTEGPLLCAWFGGSGEGNPDVGIWYSMQSQDAWTAPALAAKAAAEPHWNPVLFRDEAGQVHLFFKVGPDPNRWRSYWTHFTYPADWSDPVELVPGDIGGRGPVKNKPLVLSNGAWLAPGSTQKETGWNQVAWHPFADTSADHGQTWTRSEDFPTPSGQDIDAIQPTFWESEPGQVHALMRTRSWRIWRAESNDFGRTWSTLEEAPLPNNNSGIDALRLDDGRVVLLLNPVGAPFLFRNILALAVSEDDGEQWRIVARLEATWNPLDEFSYPAVARTESGIAVSYTWQRSRIRCWEIPLSALREL